MRRCSTAGLNRAGNVHEQGVNEEGHGAVFTLRSCASIALFLRVREPWRAANRAGTGRPRATGALMNKPMSPVPVAGGATLIEERRPVAPAPTPPAGRTATMTDGPAPAVRPPDPALATPGAGALAAALAQFDAAADHLDLEEGVRETLRSPHRELTIRFPVRLDDGRVRVFTGYRVQHNVARGPAKGGLRYHPSTDLDEVRALAMWMTWK
jgi:hypothetical protein